MSYHKILRSTLIISGISLLFTGCAAELGTAAHHAILESRLNSHWKGASIQSLTSHIKNYKPTVVTMENNQQAYRWDFTHHYTKTVEVDSYAYHNTDRPGMTTGIVYADREYKNRCQLYALLTPNTTTIAKITIQTPSRGTCPQLRQEVLK